MYVYTSNADILQSSYKVLKFAISQRTYVHVNTFMDDLAPIAEV